MSTLDAFPRAELRAGQLSFLETNGLERACRKGAFYLAEPKDIDFSPGVRLAQNFHRDYVPGSGDIYTGYRRDDFAGSKLGYSNPHHDQVEILQIEAGIWREHLPVAVADMLWAMNTVAKVTLKAVMLGVGVQASDMDRITGGLDEDNALQYCIFNHFRSAKQGALGFTAHKDSGFITVLHTKEGGLESKEDRQWVPLDPLPGHLTIVLGHSLEVLTRNMAGKVNASFHRVRSTNNTARQIGDRISFGVYVGPRMDQNLTEYAEDGALRDVGSFIDFQRAKAREMNYDFHPKFEAEEA